MNTITLSKIIEAILLSSGRPLSEKEITNLFDEEEKPSHSEFKDALDLIEQNSKNNSFTLSRVASGFRLQVDQAYAPYIAKIWQEKNQRYSRALMETITLIAYKQPITRSEIEEVRGVSVSSNLIKNLFEKGWIKVVGIRDVPGKPSLLGTTKEFLDDLGLKKLSDLPSLPEINISTESTMPLPLEDPDQNSIEGNEIIQ
ncbi:SMC-Scp complex subunit ScpB [SAR86 cluster bacterium]|jgi:segregation and condensation protein B|nr:SMC-Scp complex subunit ScpB [SAR86 cluster bacterium]|tara:strand:- start:579 stop:1178 length:600 start_codon:yes stop_codon:yes gene_type:complete